MKTRKGGIAFPEKNLLCKRMERLLFLSKESLKGINRFAGQTIAGGWENGVYCPQIKSLGPRSWHILIPCMLVSTVLFTNESDLFYSAEVF